ncbi:lipopolysaccharide heptosyltransferase family protein [Marinomonas sp. UCMA 3892]|uniref:Glycosyl transferase family 9 n=1 Tax=Marinomonas sp. (strain MWYL1) TaxID=400668 RepID=A6W103_MARMS|nr:glycosyltransferase family 9 protein [Marinomonas sp. UCMA 3892]NLU98700.1 lipopolysaccharide heptosyltransferase family protein [Marinomonas sp. UCMA 3892]
MNLVLLRNRPHFGAQITSIPVLFFFFQNYGNQDLTLLSKSNVGWIYNQLPWVKECIQSKSRLEDLKKLKHCDNLLNLRPSNRLPVILYKFIKGGRVFDFVKNDFLISLTSEKHNVLCDTEYRALAYLKIFIRDERALLNALAAPFLALIQDSNLNLDRAELNILIMPGGGAGEGKKWGIENFISAVQSIANTLEKNCHLHILLGPDEKREIQYMQELNIKNSSLHVNIPLNDIAKLVDHCDLTIANDCGPSHIAQCMQKPYIGLFREPNTEWFLSHAKSVKVLPQKGNDIKTITIKSVTEYAVNLLKSQA